MANSTYLEADFCVSKVSKQESSEKSMRDANRLQELKEIMARDYGASLSDQEIANLGDRLARIVSIAKKSMLRRLHADALNNQKVTGSSASPRDNKTG